MAAHENPHRLPGLDGLRAVSIALIVVHHLWLSKVVSVNWLSRIGEHGAIGVDVFFTISGLLITWLLLREEAANGSISLNRFYGRRAVRIIPPALVFLLVILVISIRRGTMNWKCWLAAAFFCSNVAGGDSFAPGTTDIAHYWSLSVEEQFYLVWPLCFFLIPRRARVPFLFAVFIAMPFWRQLNYHIFRGSGVNLERGDLRSDGIAVGCLVACAMEDPRWRGMLSRRFFRAEMTAIAAIAIIAALCTDTAQHLPSGVKFLYPSIVATCVALIVHRAIRRTPRSNSVFDFVLNLNVVVFVGQLSYSLYLWQQPFCMPAGAFRTNSGYFNVAGAFACAVASFFLVERPAQYIRRRLGSRTAS